MAVDPASDAGATDPRPIVVVSGIPRSGTSLMMQMLAAGGVPLLCDAHRPADESNPRGYFELRAVRGTARDPAWVSRAPGRAVKVIHALLPHLPAERRYRVIWMERDPAEVVASQNRMLERQGDAVPGPCEDRLIAIHCEQAARARALLERTAHFEWLAVEYGALLDAPLREAGRIADFLGLGDRASRLASAVDPALYRSRRA